jgi:hypothetical protein
MWAVGMRHFLPFCSKLSSTLPGSTGQGPLGPLLLPPPSSLGPCYFGDGVERKNQGGREHLIKLMLPGGRPLVFIPLDFCHLVLTWMWESLQSWQSQLLWVMNSHPVILHSCSGSYVFKAATCGQCHQIFLQMVIPPGEMQPWGSCMLVELLPFPLISAFFKSHRNNRGQVAGVLMQSPQLSLHLTACSDARQTSAKPKPPPTNWRNPATVFCFGTF